VLGRAATLFVNRSSYLQTRRQWLHPP